MMISALRQWRELLKMVAIPMILFLLLKNVLKRALRLPYHEFNQCDIFVCFKVLGFKLSFFVSLFCREAKHITRKEQYVN